MPLPVSVTSSLTYISHCSLLDTLAMACSGIVYGAEKKGISVEVQCPEDLRVSHDPPGQKHRKGRPPANL